MPPVGYKKRIATWTREDAEAAGRRWIDDHDGEIPAATDFNPSDLRRAARGHSNRTAAWLERARYFEDNLLPWTATVQRLYGSWNAYIKALGRHPRPANGSVRMLATVGIDDIQVTLNLARRTEGEEQQVLLYRLAEQALGAAGVVGSL